MRSALALMVALAPLALKAAPPIGYAQATGYFKKDSRPTLYQPLNLLDGREATAYCTRTSDPLGDVLTFGFKDAATIDEVRIYTGNGFDEQTFKDFARARKIAIRGPAGAQTMVVADQRGQQAIQVNPPLVGEQFTMEILDSYPSDDPEAPVCLSDVVFYSEGKPINGSWLTPKLKYDRARASIMGTWFAGPEGAPERYLSFFFDGTYHFVYQPYDPEQKGRELSGDYELSGSQLTLGVPGKGKVTAHASASKKTDSRGHDQKVLMLDGPGLPEDFKQTFRDRL